MDARRWIELRNVSIGYREPMVQGISLEVWAGDFFGIVGPNGAGKSTLLLTVLGNLPTASNNGCSFQSIDRKRFSCVGQS
jgi:ABC-type Mn2+/Zn2+ transport system ATPase subunit